MIDKLDKQILEYIQGHRETTLQNIGNEVGLSLSGIRRRLKKLSGAGLIGQRKKIKWLTILGGQTLDDE